MSYNLIFGVKKPGCFFNLFKSLDAIIQKNNIVVNRSGYLKSWNFFMKNFIPLKQGNFKDLILNLFEINHKKKGLMQVENIYKLFFQDPFSSDFCHDPDSPPSRLFNYDHFRGLNSCIISRP